MQAEILKNIFQKARDKSALIAYSEAQDNRILEAVYQIKEQAIASPIVLANEHTTSKKLENNPRLRKTSLSVIIQEIENNREILKEDDRIPLVILSSEDPALAEINKKLDDRTSASFIARGMQEDNPLRIASLLLQQGIVDGVVAGAATTSADVIRAGVKIIGTADVPSSCFLLLGDNLKMTFADCAVIPHPSAQQLSKIAINAAAMHQNLCQEEPRVALLSFSTKDSAKDGSIELIKEALGMIQEKEPELACDGELQFDAAFNAQVGKIKSPSSQVAGRANVFVFPDLNSGNIGYKIAQQIGKLMAIGPILMGFKAPIMDLSRGTSIDDIVALSAIAASLKT